MINKLRLKTNTTVKKETNFIICFTEDKNMDTLTKYKKPDFALRN